MNITDILSAGVLFVISVELIFLFFAGIIAALRQPYPHSTEMW